MTKQNFDVNKLRVATPCSVGWEAMTGDERIRHCQSCQLNVYNVSAMTESEVSNLISKNQSRVCVRLYRRADDSVLTKDCPVGRRAYRKRVSRFAGAALATILGLFSVSFAQKKEEQCIDASKIEIVRVENQTTESVVKGKITDPNGAVVPGVELRLRKINDKNFARTVSDENGEYLFKKTAAGTYIIEAKAAGFKAHTITDLKVKTGEEISINIELQPKSTSVTVGIYAAAEPLIDATSGSITTRISGETLRKLPF